jgi:hypothetical protein
MHFDMDIGRLNYEGKERRVGFEFESAQLTLKEMTDIVQQCFGGSIKQENEFSFEVLDTEYGTFSVESDSSYLKKKKYEESSTKLAFAASKFITDTIAGPSRLIVPNEIVTPPIPLADLYRIDLFRGELSKRIMAKTMIPSLAPCGLHLNPELADTSASYLLRILQAFMVLQDQLFKQHRVAILRRLWPYIEPFPKEYQQFLLNPDYAPDFQQLVDDYIRFNPTRDRPLDLLPVFVWIDKDCLKAYDLQDAPLVHGRPAFHYRLPNCELSNPNWNVASEWNLWASVERLADDPRRLAGFMYRSVSKADRGNELHV